MQSSSVPGRGSRKISDIDERERAFQGSQKELPEPDVVRCIFYESGMVKRNASSCSSWISPPRARLRVGRSAHAPHSMSSFSRRVSAPSRQTKPTSPPPPLPKTDPSSATRATPTTGFNIVKAYPAMSLWVRPAVKARNTQTRYVSQSSRSWRGSWRRPLNGSCRQSPSCARVPDLSS